MNPLTKQTIQIDIDAENNDFCMELIGCKLLDVYRVLKQITVQIESGEYFGNDLRIYDEHGNELSRDQAESYIRAAKEEIESRGTA